MPRRRQLEMSEDDLERLDGFETEQERFEVEAIGSKIGPVVATTYRGLRFTPGKKPSRRYMNLLLAGAREHGLPSDWIRRLEAQPAVYIPLLSDFFRLYLGAFEVFARATNFHALTNRAVLGERPSEEDDPQDP